MAKSTETTWSPDPNTKGASETGTASTPSDGTSIGNIIAVNSKLTTDDGKIEIEGATLVTNASIGVGLGSDNPTPGKGIHIKNDTTDTSSLLLLEQDGTGDSSMQFSLTGGESYSLGIDNTDDSFKISNNSNLHTDTALTIDTSNNLSANGTITKLGYGVSNAEVLIGSSSGSGKAYVGVGTQADYSSNFVDKAAVVINTVGLKGDGGSGLSVRNYSDDDFGNISGKKIQAYGQFRLGGTGAYIAPNGTTDIDFQANDETTVMRFETDNKRLGINTTTPAATLHAVGANAGYFSNSAAQDCLVTIQGGSSNDAALTFKADGGAASADITKVYQEDGVGFHIKTTNSTVDAMTILSAGNVGIGNTAPLVKLHVVGSSGDPTSSGAVASGAAMITGGSATDSGIVMGRMAGVARNWLQVQSASNTAIKTNMDLLLQPLYGKVGIGTTTPSAGLHLVDATAGTDDSIVTAMKIDANQTLSSSDGDTNTIGVKYGLEIAQSGTANVNNPTRVVGLYIPTYSGSTYQGNISAQFTDGLVLGGDATSTYHKEYSQLQLRSTSDKNASYNISENTIFIGDIGVSGHSTTDNFGGINYGTNVANVNGGIYFHDRGQTRLADIVFKTATDGSNPNVEKMRLTTEGELILTNPTAGDGDGDRSKIISFAGYQSGGEVGDLAEINVSHYGTADDKKGQFTFKVNDGDDSDGSLQTAVNIDSYKNVVIGGRTSFNGDTGSCAALYAEYTGSTMGTTSHSAPIKAIQDYDNSATAYPPSGYQRPSLLISNLDDTNNSFSFIQFAGKSDKTAYPVAIIAARNLNTGQAHGMLTFATGGASGSSHSSKILELRKNGSDTWMSITNLKDTNGDNDASDGDGARKSIVKFVGVTQDGGATYDAIEHDLANIVVSHHGTANDKKGKFEILINDGDDDDGSLRQAMFIGTHQGHVALGLDAGRNLTDSHHNQYNVFIGQNSGAGTNTGDSNVGVGTGTLFYNQKGNFNTAIGHDAAKFLQHSNDNGTTTSNADVDMYNTCIGYNAMATSKQGTNNTIIGANAGYQLKADGNIAIGRSALSAEDYGDSTVAIGNYALNMQNDVTSSSGSNSTTGNVAVGHSAGKHLEEGLDCTFIGSQAGLGSNANRLDGHDNTAVGSQAGYSLITTAAGNTLMGTKAGYLQTTANNNVVVGYNASYYNLTGGASVFVGVEAGKHARSTTGSNTIVGYKAMQNGHSTYDDNTAHSNTVMGAYAMGENTDAALTGIRNCILGAYAGKEILSSNDCILVGYNAGKSLTSGSNNIAIGSYSLESQTTASENMAIGYEAGNANAAAPNNVYIGNQAGHKIQGTNGKNTAIGYRALYNGDEDASDLDENTAYSNTVVGNNAMGGDSGTADSHQITAYQNVVIGDNAGRPMISANNNVVIGMQAGYDLSTGDYNTLIGMQCGHNLVGHSGETYIGYSAGQQIVTGSSQNTLIGYVAGYKLGGSDNDSNTAVGYKALAGGSGTYANNTAKNNTAVGVKACGGNSTSSNFTGGNNVCIGVEAGESISSAGNNTLIGAFAGDTLTVGTGNTGVGKGVDFPTDKNYQTAVGHSAVTQNTYESRFGAYGAFQFYSSLVECDLGGVADSDPAHATPIGKIPRYSIIKSVTAVITELSDSAVSNFKIVLASDSSGTDNTALSDVIEILGNGIAGTWSSAGATDVDIVAGTSAGVVKSAYGCDGDTLKALDLSARDYYIYIAHADTSHSDGDTNPGDPAIIRVCVEFAGQD